MSGTALATCYLVQGQVCLRSPRIAPRSLRARMFTPLTCDVKAIDRKQNLKNLQVLDYSKRRL